MQYGNATLLPLIGGSGGGGGAAGNTTIGSGGGGGGGAILIASSGAINVTGSILANGGNSGGSSSYQAGRGGAGSGGAIRLVASTIGGNGTISAAGGTGGNTLNSWGGYYVCATSTANYGSVGRIRLEADTITRTASSTPLPVSDTPGTILLPGGTPTLSITSVGGIAVPANPNGSSDVTIPATMNPMSIAFTTSGVTVGSTITLTVVPPLGVATTANSGPTTGTLDSATSSVSVSLPSGSNTLQASVTYTVSSANAVAMSKFTGSENVAQVRLNATLGGDSTATLITVSGKEFTVPAAALANL